MADTSVLGKIAETRGKSSSFSGYASPPFWGKGQSDRANGCTSRRSAVTMAIDRSLVTE